MQTSKTYFPGLNALRFFAALAVLVTHVEFTKKVLLHGDIFWLNIDYWIEGSAWHSISTGRVHWLAPFITQAGYMGVIFFFVLSGFLITYLLLEEKRVSNTISVRNFYVRRILRIWPLYFLVVILGFFVLPHISWFQVESQAIDLFKNFGVNLWCFVFMVPNLAFAVVMEGVPNIGHLWSIGVEEQFYLIWPLIMKRSKQPIRTIIYFLVAVVGFKLLFYVVVNFFFHTPEIDPMLMQSSATETLKRFVGSLKFESMALGALGACMVFYKKETLLRLIYHPAIQLLAFISIPLIVLFTPKSLYIGLYLMFSIPFLVIIMNVATNPKALFKLENKTLNFLGSISYGIYMYHLMCITFSFYLVDHFMDFPKRLTTPQTLMIYAVSIPLTILVSHISYKYFEKKFINRKRKFTTVISGEEARPNS